MANPVITFVEPGSPADNAGLCVGDSIVTINGVIPRDVVEWNTIATSAEVNLEIDRGGLMSDIEVVKLEGERLGAEVSSAIFDQVRTCDNHCEFCFIYQLPPGLRPSLYVKDDDYRLSFLYGNFTTLTRFNEADLERVITERLSPLYVSIHATDSDVRSRMLRNKRGGPSLRWLRALLDSGIEVHGQVVVCPGINDGEIFNDTMAGIYEQYADLASVGVVPLGVSKYTKETAMRPHTFQEANSIVNAVEAWQARFRNAFGKRVVFAADEYYILAGLPIPEAENYEEFLQIENGIGMTAAFRHEFVNGNSVSTGSHGGFFAWVDGAPAQGYRAPRYAGTNDGLDIRRTRFDYTVLVTGKYGEAVLSNLIADNRHVGILVVDNGYFGGNIGVTGLLAGQDIKAAIEGIGERTRIVIPDVCLSNDRFIDGMHVNELGRQVEIVPTRGDLLKALLEEWKVAA